MKVDTGTFTEPGPEVMPDAKQPFGDTIVIRSSQSTQKQEKISQIPDNFELVDPTPINGESFTNIAEVAEKTQESIGPVVVPPVVDENREKGKKKGSILNRLAAKFNRKHAYGVDENEQNIKEIHNKDEKTNIETPVLSTPKGSINIYFT